MSIIRSSGYSVIIFILVLLLTSCGGGGGDGNNAVDDPSLLTGYFLDSAVEGLEYARYVQTAENTFTSNTLAGLTDRNGAFRYKEGEYIRFKIGNIDFFIFIPAKRIMSPLDFGDDLNSGRRINIASFIQSLDDDADLTNGILITEAVRQRASTITGFLPSFNFDYPTLVNPIVRDLTSVTSAGVRDLVDTSSASAHLNSTLNFANPGAFPFIYGSYIGTYTIQVNNCLDPTDNGIYHFTVELAIQNQQNESFVGSAIGTISIGDQVLEENVVFTGTILDSGAISGSSSHTFVDTEGEGSFSGQLSGNTITITNSGADTVGDTCTFVREITVSR